MEPLTEARVFEQWVAMEREFINEKLDDIRGMDSPWSTPPNFGSENKDILPSIAAEELGLLVLPIHHCIVH